MITLDEEAFAEWARPRPRGLDDRSSQHQECAPSPAAVDDANVSVSRAESIRKFAVLPHDLTVAAGELTPTLKVRRAIVAKTYESVIEKRYG